jgi:chromosome segregation ATPase
MEIQTEQLTLVAARESTLISEKDAAVAQATNLEIKNGQLEGEIKDLKGNTESVSMSLSKAEQECVELKAKLETTRGQADEKERQYRVLTQAYERLQIVFTNLKQVYSEQSMQNLQSRMKRSCQLTTDADVSDSDCIPDSQATDSFHTTSDEEDRLTRLLAMKIHHWIFI